MVKQDSGIPVEGIAGVILKYDLSGNFIDVVGVSNSPERAAVVADTLKTNPPTFNFQVRAVRVYAEKAV